MENEHAKIAAFKQLLGLEALPGSGSDALEAIKRFSEVVLSTIRPDPIHQLTRQYLHGGGTSAKQRFADVSTGMRLRYLEWPGGDSDAVLLLHGAAECADVWEPVASRLSERGYSLFALDMRGHGGSSRSAGGRYDAALMAEDVQGFIVAKDLYVRPVAVVGCGIAGVVALTLAQACPSLVGAVAVVEFGLPPALVAAAGARQPPCSPQAPHQAAVVAPPQQATEQQRMSSAEVLPWWSFWLGQGCEFWSVAECAAYLCSPLANLGPLVLLPLASAAAAQAAAVLGDSQQQQEEAAASVRAALSGLGRAPACAAHAAACLLQHPETRGGYACGGGDGTLQLKVDPAFFFTFDLASLVHGMASLSCHLLIVHSVHSAWVPPQDAAALAAAATAVASCTTEALPRGSHHPATDCPEQLLQRLVAFLEGPAVLCFDVPASKADARRPEALGLRSLPQFASLEEGKRALGPRRIPTAAAVEGELQRLRLEAGGGEEGEGEGAPAVEYFGFVG